MSAYHHGVGALGERIALQLLQDKGYRLLERNYRVRGGEIDLIMMDGASIVFVEVKTRTANTYGQPEDALTPRKRQRLEAAAGVYLTKNNGWEQSARFDVVTVTGRNGQWTSCHLINAFEAGGR